MDPRRYLYHARINSRLTLEQIGVRTAMSPSVLRNLDEGRFERLPSGVYARSYVRAFASAVGLDPDDALAELEALLPGAPDPLPGARADTGRGWPAERMMRWLAAAGPAADLTRYGAPLIDAIVLLIVEACLVLLIAWSSGIRIEALLSGAGWALGAFCAIPIALHFVLFGGIAGATPGGLVCELLSARRRDRARDPRPLTLPDILRRAVGR